MTVSVFDFEAELLACAAGDRSAFLALYRHEAPTMRALCLAMLGDAEAADAVLHETFVLIWRNAAGYSTSIGTARAWMYSILRYRARARQQADQNPPPLPSLAWPAQMAPDTVRGALAALPEPQREALLQAYLHGGSPAHIAGQLDRSEPDVRASLQAALAHLEQAAHA